VDFLALVQSLHYEAKLPGSPPAAVTAQSGRAADLVRWIIEAWNDIQRDKDGRWKWRRSEWFVNTVADDASYVFSDCTDVIAAATITRFHAWELDDDDPPFIYLVSEGKTSERELPIARWNEFRRLYLRATHDPASPSQMSVDHTDALYFGPTPNDIYRVTGNYWKSIQNLVNDVDVPEMPSDFHMLIVYRALLKYAYNVVGQDILARAQTEGTPIYDALVENQWYGRFRISFPPPLA